MSDESRCGTLTGARGAPGDSAGPDPLDEMMAGALAVFSLLASCRRITSNNHGLRIEPVSLDARPRKPYYPGVRIFRERTHRCHEHSEFVWHCDVVGPHHVCGVCGNFLRA